MNDEIIQRSHLLMKRIEAGEAGINGARYEAETGIVEFYNETKIIKGI